MTGRERKAINRNHFNSHVWKPALAGAEVIAPLKFTPRKYSHFLPRAGARGSAAIDAIFA
ncbi:hypothetical protein OG909_26580 [Streptomyces sp. NBC_01754]|uniref:hypothetical protein n=1 Tax=Streptomyces sp. NBC_01754 TaxID=2975930 RepID=UPI002DDB23E1|nr:hypothetical protein [Streptomyces sp. NBC_01754]WSC95568.1 hypothetical protein OG909_26580 [Streptomyces sp. NBC_01754]